MSDSNEVMWLWRDRIYHARSLIAGGSALEKSSFVFNVCFLGCFLLLFVLFCLVRKELQLTCLGPVLLSSSCSREIILIYFTMRSQNHQTTLFWPTPLSPLKKERKKKSHVKSYRCEYLYNALWQVQIKIFPLLILVLTFTQTSEFWMLFCFVLSPTQKHWEYTSHYSSSLFYETLCKKRSLFPWRRFVAVHVIKNKNKTKKTATHA